jgi:hypothetical protein
VALALFAPASPQIPFIGGKETPAGKNRMKGSGAEKAPAGLRATLINLTLIIVALLFFSFSCGKLRKTTLKYALIYSRLNKSVLSKG